MNVTLPLDLETRVGPQALALDLAIGMLLTGDATIGQAAQVAGLTQSHFLIELGRRRIPLPYGPNELADDLKAVRELTRS